MSVTRYINADTPTQVNSSLIGVGVHPSLGNISFNFTYQYVKTVSGIVGYIEGDDRPYKVNGSLQYEGQRYAKFICAVEGQDQEYYYRYLTSSPFPLPPREGTQMYILASTDPIVLEEAGVCTGTDTLEETRFVIIGPETGGYIPLADGYQLDTATGEIDVNGNIYYAESRGSASESITASYAGKEDNKYFFECIETSIGDYEVYTEGYPVINGEVHFPDDVYVVAPSYVSGIVDGDLSCSVEFSVDGKTWTLVTVDENLTDVNNVIANVPRYVYLRFSQDVEITEE